MSTQTTRPKEGTESHDEDLFTPVSRIRRVDHATLARMAPPDSLVDGEGRLMFAVASRVGVMRTPSNDHEYETEAVLYLSADGSEALERYYPRGIETAPRGCVIPPRLTHESGLSDRYADELALHPEVE